MKGVFMKLYLVNFEGPPFSRESSRSSSLLSRTLAVFISLVLIFLLSVPSSFAQILGSPTYYSSRFYPLTLLSQGDPLAGMHGTEENILAMPTTRWSNLAVNMNTGNAMVIVQAINLPGTPLPLSISLLYHHRNAAVNIGLGSGWMTTLHTAVAIDQQTLDITWLTPDGQQLVFTWNALSSSYDNPYGFAGKAEVLGNGTIKITPLGQGSIIYDSNGKLIEIQDKCTTGSLEVSYDNGRPVSLEDSLSGRSITLSWNLQSQLESIEDPSGQVWELNYDQSGDYLLSITPPSEEQSPPSLLFGYDTQGTGFLNTHEDLLGNEYSLSYYSSGSFDDWFQDWTDPASITTGLSYDDTVQGFDLVTTFTDGEARDYHYGFNSEGYPTQVWQEENSIILAQSYGYTQEGWRNSIKDAYGKETTLSYDNVGHIVSMIAPPPAQGGTSFEKEWTYSPSNDLDGLLTQQREKVTSSVWATTIYQYNDQNSSCQPSHITNPLSQTTVVSYTPEGFVSTVTVPTPSGTKSMSYSYSAFTKALTGMIDFGGNETEFSYKTSGLIDVLTKWEGLSASGRKLSEVTHSFNVLHLLIGTTDSVNSTTTGIVYNENGATEEATNENGCSSKATYPIFDPTPSPVFPGLIPPSLPGLLPPGDGCYPGLPPQIPAIPIFPSIAPYRPLPSETTNTMNQTSSYTFDDSGKITLYTNHLDQDTSLTYDVFGRTATQTSPFGKSVSYTYDLNSRITEIEVDGEGITSYTYDWVGRLTEKDDPVQGIIEYTYNVRGDLLSDDQGSYSYDILGRVTSHPTRGSFSYTSDGHIATHNGKAYAYNNNGNLTSWESDGGTVGFAYSGLQGSTRLGLPSSMTGNTNISSYAFSYTPRHLLSNLTVTSKNNQSFTYAWSSAGELQSMVNPNNTTLTQTWSSKLLTALSVKHSQTQVSYLSSSQSFSGEQQLTDYDYMVVNGVNPLTYASESNDLTYDASSRLSTLTRSSDNRVVTYGYDQNLGRLNSINLSNKGTYSLGYNSNGSLDSVTYPNQQGSEAYTYDGTGKLQSISYPDSSIMSFTWTAREKIATIQYSTSQNVVHSYVLTYDNENNLKTSTYSIDGLQQNSWFYVWGPQGLEYANKNSGALTQNLSTDLRGRILSMTYNGSTYAGELYFHYDALGNTTLLTDANSNPIASFQYDLHTGRLISSWNPSNLEIINLNDGITGSINLTAIQAPGMGKDITIQPWPPVKIGGSTNGDNLGSFDISIEGARVKPGVVSDNFGKDCGDDGMRTMGKKKDPCKILPGDSCEEVFNKFIMCQLERRDITLNKNTCDKISSCKKQIDNFIQNKPHCVEPDWINDYTCFWWSVSSGARFLRGKGEEYANIVQNAFSTMFSKCKGGGY
jgi:YD repeat-containing protein